ncbi:hypothetical protein RHGRI_020458 [Rhododendron griersonianum]|uniref:Uncharacterized protein n=1 Tax=Rhododendron griersonianum TaxID=479676 RepID=A0AAV6JGK6_9ERIC|nr:hypothetical protein RHGRI_020458 [Rhododendron griersonianum]
MNSRGSLYLAGFMCTAGGQTITNQSAGMNLNFPILLELPHVLPALGLESLSSGVTIRDLTLQWRILFRNSLYSLNVSSLSTKGFSKINLVAIVIARKVVSKLTESSTNTKSRAISSVSIVSSFPSSSRT